jgi:hypothetical protein
MLSPRFSHSGLPDASRHASNFCLWEGEQPANPHNAYLCA